MKKLTALPVFLALIVSILLLVGVYHWLKPASASKAFSEEETKKLLESMYAGDVMNTEWVKEGYQATLENAMGIYTIIVDNTTGEIKSIVLKELKETDNQDPAKEKDGPILSEQDIETLIKSEVTGKIQTLSLQEKDGKTLYQSTVKEDGKTHYFEIDAQSGEILSFKTEIEEPTSNKFSKQDAINIALSYLPGEVEGVQLVSGEYGSSYLIFIDGDEDEATIEVSAVTGKILSVTWEDRDDDDDGDDDDDDDNDENDDSYDDDDD